VGGHRHQGCSGNSQPGNQGESSWPREAGASITPELEDGLPTLCQHMCPQTSASADGTFGEKHFPGGFEEHREMMRCRDSGKLRIREVRWAAELISRMAVWKNSW